MLEARVSRALGGQSALAWVFGVGLVVILPIALIHGVPDASASAWAWAMVSAVCSLAGLALMFTGLQYGRVGLVTATISVQGAFAAIYAAIGGESLHPLSLVAMAVSAVGTFVLMSGDGGLQAPPRERRGILLGLAGACFTGLSLYAAARGGSGIGADWVLVCIRLSSVALVTVPLAAARRLRNPRGVVVPTIVAGIGEVVAFAAYIEASNRIGVAVPAVIASQFALIAAAVGLARARRAPRAQAVAGRGRDPGWRHRADDLPGLIAVQRPLTAVRRRRSAPHARATDARGMPSFPLDARRLPAATAIVAAVPAGPIALMTTGSGRLALFALGLVPAVVIVVGPRLWPGWSRLGGLVLIGPVMVTMIVPGLFALFLAFFELCASDQTRTYLRAPGAAAAICAFFLPYALGSAWAVARPGRALWAWPLVMLAAIALSIVVLALVEGGPHHCET